MEYSNSAEERERHLRMALEHRTTIGVAMGTLMERYDIDQDEAFDHLRRLSQEQNRKLRDVAKELSQRAERRAAAS
jgi:AmiR/NasT family two-component response regulator